MSRRRLLLVVASCSTPLARSRRRSSLPPEFDKVRVLTPDWCVRAKAAGYRIWVWPNDSALENEPSYRKFLKDGVSGLNAAQPAQAVAALKG